MGLIGKEIIQSRVWVNPTPTPPPDLNYKYTYPITVFDAVRKDMNDENSATLTTMLDLIFKELKGKQPIFAGKPSNNLMTFGGVAGAVGSIRISQDIPWDPEQQKHDRIPTEKAVGQLLLKLGIVNPDGSVNGDGEGKLVRWSDVVGRPNIYTDLGMNEDGFITQKGVTLAINAIDSHLLEHEATVAVKFDNIQKRIDQHTTAINPHNVTAEDVGAPSKPLFDFHVNEAVNPHNITKETLGLENVDNTADLDKPMSNETKAAIDAINELLDHMTDDVGGLKFVVNLEYDQAHGLLTWTYNDGSKLSLSIPVDGLVDEISYDPDTKELVVHELGGIVKRVDVSDLFIRYIGSQGANVLVEIDGDQTTGDQVIKASIIANSITEAEMADDSVITRMIQDQAVTTGKIHDLTITTIKYADQSITTEKIAELAITNSRLDSRAVDGRILFSSTIADRVLAVREANSDPVWVQIVTEMIARDAIHTENILNGAVTSDKLGPKAVITSKLEDEAVTNDKLAPNAVTNNKIATGTIDGSKLVTNPAFVGVPTISSRPDASSDTNEVPDTRWVRDFAKDATFVNSNLADRSVDGRVLFSSPVKNRALVVLKANQDPVWSLINHDMMDDNAIGTDNIIDLAVTGAKINDKSIESRHMTVKAVQTDHIADDAVTSNKLFKSNMANRVLASLTDYGNPVYSQITRPMIEYNAIGTMQIEDRSVSLAKLETSDSNQRVLAVGLRNTDPVWMQVANKMVADRAIDGRTLMTSPTQDTILGVTVPGTDPAWLKISGGMMQERIIKREHIENGAIWTEHLQEKLIESRHIMDWTIQSNNIAPRAITGIELFTSAIPNRVLAVTTAPYSNPAWVQVTTDMIEDQNVTKEKIFQSAHPYRVLAATQAGVPPEYTMVSHEFIVDNTITPNKLQPNFVLHGTPELTMPPREDADNFQIANTRWVRRTVANMINDFNPEILFDTVDGSMIQDHVIDGTKLMQSPFDGPRVLGVTKANEDVEFILIEEDLIVNGSVTSNKIQRSVHLLGSPKVEIRPGPQSSDATGTGQLIPDCQWVLDRISDASFGGGSSGGSGGGGEVTGSQVEISGIPGETIEGLIDGTIVPKPSDPTIIGGIGGGGGQLLPGSVLTEYIMDRAVTANKLFTTEFSNRVLSVIEPNSDPTYVKVSQSMLELDRIIDNKRLFTSDKDNTLLGVRIRGGDPEYLKVNNQMLEDGIIETRQLVDRSVTNEKLANGCITSEKLGNDVIINSTQILDESITTQKLAKRAVENDRIADGTIAGTKMAPDLELPAYTSVTPHTDYERRAVRNTVLSPNAPSGGSNGDIWFRYI